MNGLAALTLQEGMLYSNSWRQLVENGAKSILFSTPITSDLETCIDCSTFIHDGRIIACSTKVELIGQLY